MGLSPASASSPDLFLSAGEAADGGTSAGALPLLGDTWIEPQVSVLALLQLQQMEALSLLTLSHCHSAF